MVNLLKRLAATISYVTCIPVSFSGQERQSEQISRQADLSGLAKYLSTVGLLIGLALCLGLWLLHFLRVTGILCGVILTLGWLCLTGGFHFDGLMDTADGIFSHRSVESMLKIMSDSRVGNYGVMTGISVLLIKIACLASLPLPQMYPVLLLCPSWARWCASFAIGHFPYLKESGMGKIWHDTMKYPQDLFAGAIVPFTATCLLVPLNPALIPLCALATIAAGCCAAYRFANKLGGHTGDTYGAIVELAESGGLLIVLLLQRLY